MFSLTSLSWPAALSWNVLQISFFFWMMSSDSSGAVCQGSLYPDVFPWGSGELSERTSLVFVLEAWTFLGGEAEGDFFPFLDWTVEVDSSEDELSEELSEESGSFPFSGSTSMCEAELELDRERVCLCLELLGVEWLERAGSS